jgi:putative DNA primase/helicase
MTSAIRSDLGDGIVEHELPTLDMEKGEAGVDKVFTGFNCTDMGNAKRFIALFGENIRYCAELKTWLLWTGIVWAKDSLGGVIELAKGTVERIHTRSHVCLEVPRLRERHEKRSVSTPSSLRLEAVLTL